MKKEINQLKSGAVLSYVNLALGMLIPFLYTPVMLRILGQSEYGLYSLAGSVAGYLSLLNFGVSGAFLRYVTRARASGDPEGEARVAGLFIKLYAAVCAAVFLAGAAVAMNADLFFEKALTPEELRKIRILVLIMALNTGVAFPMGVYSAITVAHERFVFNRLLGIAATVVTPCLNLAMLYLGFQSVGLTLSATILTLLSFLVNIVYCGKKLKLRPRFGKAPPGLLGEILRFSVFIFVSELVNVLYWSTDRIILGMRLGTEAVAVYNIGATFNGVVQSISGGISNVFTPRINAIVARTDDSRVLSDLMIRVGRIQFLILSLAAGGFVVFGRQFIALWAGADYAGAYPVALMVLLPLMVPLVQSIALQVAVARNRHQFRAWVYLAVALLNVAATWFLVPGYGVNGAAFATGAAYILGPVLAMNWFYQVKIGLDIPGFWKNIVKMLPVPVLMAIAGALCCRVWDTTRAAGLLLGVGAYTFAFCAAAWLFAMNAYQRALILSPLRKILKRSGEK